MSADVRRIMLSLNIDAKVKSATQAIDEVTSHARDLADQVDKTEGALLHVADGADVVATNFSTLAGAAGDIAGGLDLVGLGQFSDELDAVATPLMFVAGIADTVAVATNAMSGANIRARATTIAKSVSEKAAAVATKSYAAVQWALNAAMSANPIALVVLAVVALVAAIVIAYKHSARFRAIVQAVGRVGRKAIGWVVDKVGDLVGWVKDKLPGAFNVMKGVAVRVFNALPITVATRGIMTLIGWVKDKLPAAWTTMKAAATKAWKAVTAPIQAVVGFVQDLIDKLSNIHWPDPPGWLSDIGSAIGGLIPGRLALPASSQVSATAAPTVQIIVQGALDPDAVARQIRKILNSRDVRLGLS